MLLNISSDYSSKKAKIDNEVGKAFNLEQRKNLDGISLKEIPISAASIDLYNLLTLNENQSFCSIEMRPGGILISFTSLKEVFCLIMPYHKLKIYKGRAEEYSFYRDNSFIKIRVGKQDRHIHAFIRKIRRFKSDNAPTRIEDLL